MEKPIEKWEIKYDKGINKILKENNLPATASFLIVFSKDFISTFLQTVRREAIESVLPKERKPENSDFDHYAGFNACRSKIIQQGNKGLNN